MPGNVSAPQAAGLPQLAAGPGGTARKGDPSQTDPAFAALLAMLVGQGVSLPAQLIAGAPPIDGQAPQAPSPAGAPPLSGQAPTQPELLALLLQASQPAPAAPQADTPNLAATEPVTQPLQEATVPDIASVQIEGSSIFENTERDEEPAPVKAEPLRTEPLRTEPLPTKPLSTEPLKAEPLKAEPLKAEPLPTVPLPTEPLIPPAAAGHVHRPDEEIKLPEPLRRLTRTPVTPDRLIQVVSEAAVKTEPGEYTVTLRLHPQELGEVKLQLHLNGRQVQAVMEVAHPQVQRTLEAQGDALRQNLTQAGFTLSGFEVSTGPGGQGTRDRQEQLEDLLRTQRRGRGGPAPGSTPSVRLPGRARSGGRLDTTA